MISPALVAANQWAWLISAAETSGQSLLADKPVFSQILALIGALLIFAGAAFTLLAAIGLLRFRDLLSRTHAAAKPQMLGLMLLCAGLVLIIQTWQWVLICTLVIAIQMVAAPVASHLLGRAAYRRGLAQSDSLVTDELREGRDDRT